MNTEKFTNKREMKRTFFWNVAILLSKNIGVFQMTIKKFTEKKKVKRALAFGVAVLFAVAYSLFDEIKPYPEIMFFLCILVFDVDRLHERLDKMESKKDDH